jgi:hypothetical protein
MSVHSKFCIACSGASAVPLPAMGKTGLIEAQHRVLYKGNIIYDSPGRIDAFTLSSFCYGDQQPVCINNGKQMKKFLGKTLKGKVVSVHVGNNEDLSKQSQTSLKAEIGGFSGDKHQGPERETWEGEWQPAGTIRRNERQWSAVSVEELAHITERLDLTEPLSATTLGANLCIEGVAEFSLLPKGTSLVFPSGAMLMVEEYNPPCSDMGAQIASKYATRSGEVLTDKAWLRPASGRRGLVGVIDFPGDIHVGDEVEVRVYEEPVIRLL